MKLPLPRLHIALGGTPAGGAQRFRYVLDRHLERSGSTRLTFHGLTPGRHHLEVLSAATSTARASTTFTVRAPRPVAVVVPAEAPRTTNTTPLPRTPPPTETTTSAPPPKASSPPSSGGIPQGPNAGDGDGDNNGAPSDGDGNL